MLKPERNAHSKIDCQNFGPGGENHNVGIPEKREMCFFSKNSNVAIVAPEVMYLGSALFHTFRRFKVQLCGLLQFRADTGAKMTI